jgi:nicotinamidase-related amidase
VNSHQKYTGIKVSHTHDPEAVMAAMRSDLVNGVCFTCPCNTKKRAEEIDMRLRQEFPGSSIKCYTSEQGHFNAEDVDAEWSRNAIIYSPTITTGVDFNPKVPQNVYLFIDGDQTVSPPTALQMIARNRNIKEVHICSMSMRNCPEWATRDVHTFKEMSQSFDSDGKTMRELMSSTVNKYTGEYEYTEDSFAKVYKEHRWMDNMLRSSFLHTLDTLLVMRGFQVIRSEITEVSGTYDWDPIEHLVKQEKEEKFESYLNNSLTDADRKYEEGLDRRLKTLHRSKDELRKLIDSNPDHKELYVKIFTDAKTFENNKNVVLALYTDDKLREKYERIGQAEYDILRQQTLTKKCLLLREMIAVMNHGMTPQLKPYDLTLLQSDYDEYESINATDKLWQLYKHHKQCKQHRSVTEEKPQTRKAWMECIFSLFRDVFGNTFTVKKKTSKGGEKCYNYVTEQHVLEVAIELMNWDLRNLDYIAQEIVQTYDLKRRKENDQHNKEMAEAS